MKTNLLYTLVLASKSPRRKELLGHLGIPFEIRTCEVEEVSSETNPKDVVEDLAKQKGLAAYNMLSEESNFGDTYFPVVVASDTLVALGDKIYGKPKGKEDATRILRELAGKTHEVSTGVYLGRLDIVSNKYIDRVFSCTTEVTFGDISEDVLDQYISTGDSLDKAGAYGIQGPSLTFITGLNGSYSNVVGFPLAEFIIYLKEFLGHSSDNSRKWRSIFNGEAETHF